MGRDELILQGKEVAVGYHKGKDIHWVARDLSFSMRTGQLVCLLGPNGVGKSTLIKAIMGQKLPVAGEILFQGEPIQQLGAQRMARKVSVVLTDRISPGNLDVRQLVGLGRIPFTNWLGNLSEEDEKAIDQAIAATNIGYLKEKKVAELSDGQLQKVMIARALAQDGELMVLDEPTAHLDLINRMEIMQLLRDIAHSRNKAILVVTHDLDIAVETADAFWLMPCGGRMVNGTPEDMILSGDINQLLPDEKFYFNPSTGKIQSSNPLDCPQIEGPEEVAQWLKLALRKNHLPLKNIKITVQTDPLLFMVDKNGTEMPFTTIQEVVNYIRSSVNSN
jgi:iron complex transport system ATP-binding protein